TARIQVRLPPGLQAAFRTQNGPIRLEYVSGRLTAGVTNGSIEAAALAGGIHASATNGSVALDLLSVSSPTEVTVVNGGIRVTLPADIQANLEASALNGRLRVDEAFTVGAMDASGAQSRVTGRLNGGGPAISL